MKSFLILLFAAGAMLVASPALAGHCDAEVAAVDSAAASTTVGQNVIQATAALVGHALEACELEQVGGTVLDPAFVTAGRAMLINAVQLLSGQ